MVREVPISHAAGALGAVQFALNILAAVGVYAVWLAAVIPSYLASESTRSLIVPFFAGVAVYVLIGLPLLAFGLRGMKVTIGWIVAVPAIAVVVTIVIAGARMVANIAQARSSDMPSLLANMAEQLVVGGALLFVLVPLSWAVFRYAALSAEAREMARPSSRVGSLSGALGDLLGFWPGFRRPPLLRILSTIAMAAAAALQSIGAALTVFTTIAVVGALTIVVLQSILSDGSLVDDPRVIALVFGFQFLLAVVLSWIPLLLASLLRNLARAMTRNNLEARVRHDDRPPTLFLRSFQDDQVKLPRANILARAFAGELGARRLDHILVEQFSRYAPILALGKPGEKSLPFGAARVYVDHDNWQAKVHELAAKARFVILIADPSPGVRWEIDTMLSETYREKLLILCAPRHGDLRDLQSLAAWLPQDEHNGLKSPVVASYLDKSGETVALRARGKLRTQTYQVALQAFFRSRTPVAVGNP